MMAAIRAYPLLRAAVADASRVVHDLAAACQQPIEYPETPEDRHRLEHRLAVAAKGLDHAVAELLPHLKETEAFAEFARAHRLLVAYYQAERTVRS